MSDNKRPPRQDDPVVTDEALKKAEQYIEEEEGAINKLPGALGVFTTALAVIMSLFHLYAAYGIMPTHVLRGIHVAFILFLGFLLFPVAKRFRHRVCWWDWLAALISLVIVCNMLFGGDAFLERAIDPGTWDKILGVALILLVLEAARRTSGWIMPAICVGFLVYAVVGQYLPPPWTHYGMDTGRIVGHMYMTLEGIFGVAIDVSSSLIILFTIYGAFLQYSGRRQVLHRLLVRGDGRQADRRRTHHRAGVVPARRTVGQRRCDHRDAGFGRLPDADESRLRQGRRGRAARRGRPGRDHLAAGAGRRGVPDRAVPQHLVPRRDTDGDDTDAAVLLRAVPDGRDRRAQVRHAQRRHRKARHDRRAHAQLLVSFPVAGRDHLFHGDRLFAGGVGVLGDRGRVRLQLPARRLRADSLRRAARQAAAGRGAVELRA